MNQSQVSRQRSKRRHLWLFLILIIYTLYKPSYRARMSTTVPADEVAPLQYDRPMIESTIATTSSNQMIPRAHRTESQNFHISVDWYSFIMHHRPGVLQLSNG